MKTCGDRVFSHVSNIVIICFFAFHQVISAMQNCVRDVTELSFSLQDSASLVRIRHSVNQKYIIIIIIIVNCIYRALNPMLPVFLKHKQDFFVIEDYKTYKI